MKKIIRGAIFYASLSPALGSEEKGYRPVVILQNDIGNKYSPTTVVAPISTKGYKDRFQPTHVRVYPQSKLKPNSIILLEQVRVVDKKRLKGFVGLIDDYKMKEINKALKIAFDLNKEDGNDK